MTSAILSDIHGNLEALTAVLEYLEKNSVDQIFCLGDIVGYGPSPNQCIELVRKYCTASVMGNHDYAVIGSGDTTHFNTYAKISTVWTREILTERNADYLKKLPFVNTHYNVTLVHATPHNPSNWDYILSHKEAVMQLNAFKSQVCFIGHSHIPIIFTEESVTRDSSYILEENKKYIINVGSVGQPRDGDVRTCFTIYNSEENTVEYIRLKYDIQKTYNKISDAGLPIYLAERLLKGY